VLIKSADGRWRLPTPEERPATEVGEEASEFDGDQGRATTLIGVPAFDPSRWVQHVDRFLRTETSLFYCRRYG
jgi:hypothetical protein